MVAKLMKNDGEKSIASIVIIAQLFAQLNQKIDFSWDGEAKDYSIKIWYDDWDNGREMGYVVWVVSPSGKRQLNIAFFEHRSSDNTNVWVYETEPSRFGQSPSPKDITDEWYFEAEGIHSFEFGDWDSPVAFIWDSIINFWTAG